MNSHGTATLGQGWLQSGLTLRCCGVCANLPHLRLLAWQWDDGPGQQAGQTGPGLRH